MIPIVPRFVMAFTVLAAFGTALQEASAGDLELAASRSPDAASGILMELDRAGFDGEAVAEPDEDGMAEAIADFEHLIGWPETGEPSPAILGALRDYNAREEAGAVDF